MKKTLFIYKGILLAGITLLASACADSVQVSSQYSVAIKAFYIHPDETSFSFISGGGTKTFTVYSQDTPWEIDLSSDWLSVSPSSGNTTTQVTLTAKENPRATARNAQFTLKSATSEWSYSNLMSATSQAALAYANPETNSINVTASAASITLSVDANCDFYVDSDAGWVTVDRVSESQVNVFIAENGTRDARTTHFYFNYAMGGTLAIIEVNQQMPNVAVTTNTLEYGINGGTYRLNVTSDVSWSLQTSQTFVDARTASGGTTGEPGTTEVIIEASPNATYQERNGYVYLSLSQERWAQIPVHQEGVYLRLKNDATEFSSSARANVSHIEIESNAPWKTDGWPDWATPLNTSGTGNGVIEVSMPQNDNTTARSKSISLTPDMAGATAKSFTLRQRNFEFNSQEKYLECSDFSQTISYHIVTDADWSTFSDQDWFFTTPASGSNDAEIFVNVQENKGMSDRNGIAYTYALNNYYPVNVLQKGWIAKYHYDPDPISVPCKDGAQAVIQINTNDRWTAKLSKNESWVRATGLEGGTGDGTITVTFDENASINARGVSLEISYEHGEQVSIVPVKQEGRTVKLNSSGIFFFAKGGSSTIAVAADGTYGIEIISGSDWFSIQQNQSNNTFVITASENTSGAVREGGIRVYLTNLLDGEALSFVVKVTQTTALAGFTMLGWDDAEDLNVYSNLTIEIIGFGETDIWGMKESFTGAITVEGYDKDNDWNRVFDFNSLILTGFLDDENVSYPSSDTGIDGEGYNDEDENWD